MKVQVKYQPITYVANDFWVNGLNNERTTMIFECEHLDMLDEFHETEREDGLVYCMVPECVKYNQVVGMVDEYEPVDDYRDES